MRWLAVGARAGRRACAAYRALPAVRPGRGDQFHDAVLAYSPCVMGAVVQEVDGDRADKLFERFVIARRSLRGPVCRGPEVARRWERGGIFLFACRWFLSTLRRHVARPSWGKGRRPVGEGGHGVRTPRDNRLFPKMAPARKKIKKKSRIQVQVRVKFRFLFFCEPGPGYPFLFFFFFFFFFCFVWLPFARTGPLSPSLAWCSPARLRPAAFSAVRCR